MLGGILGLTAYLNRLDRFGDEPVAILPGSIVQVASRAARLWVVVRSLDHPVNGGNGSGFVRISIAELCQWLNRSERSVWRYLKDALSKKFLHSCHCENGQLQIEYRGLKSLCRLLGLDGLGAIAEFPLREIQHAKTRATDTVTEKVQAQSFYKMGEEWGKFAKGSKTAAVLLHNASSSGKVPGDAVIVRGKRLLYLEPYWRPFGASQQTIADRLGVSLRTVQYRLSNDWRQSRGIPEIDKAQSARQILSECPKAFLRDFMHLEENSEQKYVFLGSRLFEIGTNLYNTGVLLRSMRRQKWQYVEDLEAYYNADGESTENRRAPKTLHHTTGGGASNLSLRNSDSPESQKSDERVKLARL